MWIEKQLKLHSAALIYSLLNPSVASAYPFLYTGIHQIANSGLSALGSSDATATAANPANLSDAQATSSYADMAIVSMQYIYAHTNYDPVYLKTVAPPVNLGLNVKTDSGLSFGLLVSPRTAPGAKPIRVNSVPTFTGAGYALFNLDIEQSGFMGGLGAGYKLPGTGWSVGLTLLYGEDAQEISAYASEGDQSLPGMDMKYSGRSIQGLMGIAYAGGRSSLGMTFRSPAARRYDGDIASALTDNVYDHYNGVSYHPAQLTGAVQVGRGVMDYMMQVNRDFWSLGRNVANRGLPYGSPETDFKDSFGVSFAAKLRQSDSTSLSASCGYYSANTGDGSAIDHGSTALDDTAIPVQTGMEFGQMEAIPRAVLGAGMIRTLGDNRGSWVFSGNYQTGTRTIPVGHKGEGWYHIDVFTVASGLNVKF
jgi:hypothetical protein